MWAGSSLADNAQPDSSKIPREVRELEGKIIASRRSIRSGEFSFKIEEAGRREHNSEHHIWFSADGRIRQERKYGGELQVCIFGKENAFYYSDSSGRFDNPDPQRRFTVEYLPTGVAKPSDVPFMVRDPRTLMMLPGPAGLIYLYRLESFIEDFERKDVQFSSTTWNKLDAFTVSCNHPKTGNHVEYDVVPSRDYNIVRWRMTGSFPSNEGKPNGFSCLLSCDLEQMPGGSWFPSKIDYSRSTDADHSQDERVWIKPIAVNQEIPEKVFSLAGGTLPSGVFVVPSRSVIRVKPPPGRDVTWEGPVLYWKDKQLRPLTRADELEREASHKAAQEAEQKHQD